MKIKLKWDCDDNNITHYNIYKNDIYSVYKEVPVGIHEYEDLNVDLDSNFNYFIAPVDTNKVRGPFLAEVVTTLCEEPQGEIFQNRNFDCGTYLWETNNYDGIITSESKGTLKLTAETPYSSITQTDKFPIPAGNYHMGVVVNSITGTGKYAYKTNDGSWHQAFTFDAPGTYELTVNVSREIIAIDIGANGDDTFEAVFGGVACIDTAQMPLPDWYKIPSLSSNDILGVWDWTWLGHATQSDTFVNLEGGDGKMSNISIENGNPTWAGHEEGINFGGAGSVISRFPDGLDMRDVTVLFEFHKVSQNGVLDAFYSHYFSGTNGRYTLQNGWDSNSLRWCCGDNTATTVAAGNVMTEGVICTSGRDLYANAVYLATVPDSGVSSSSGLDFRFGCLRTTSLVQFSKVRLKKLLIVKRVLTNEEQSQIYNLINGYDMNTVTHNGEPVTHNGEVVLYTPQP